MTDFWAVVLAYLFCAVIATLIGTATYLLGRWLFGLFLLLPIIVAAAFIFYMMWTG